MAAQRIEFSQHEVELIERLVKDGVYADASEAVHEGLRLLERERQGDTLRAEVQKGFNDLDEGRYTEINSDEELDAFMDDLSAQAAERVAARRR